MENTGLPSRMDSLIDKVLDGKANACEVSLVEEWVDSDEANRRVFEQKRAVHEALEPPFDAAEVDTGRALRHLHWKMRMRKVSRASWARAAVVALVLCTAAVWAVVAVGDAGQGNMICLTTPFGATIEAQLPDGSRVWLNSNSRLEYPAVFDDDRRCIKLVGEGYFEVHADKRHPFVVRAGENDICATGTAFNINAYTDETVDVMLVSGSVDVVTGEKGQIRLFPEDNLCISGSGISVTHHADIGKHCAWKDGRILFDNDNLSVVLARLSQIYPVDFVVADPALLDARYHATFTGEGLHEILHLLEVGIPMRCERRKGDGSGGRTIIDVYPVK